MPSSSEDVRHENNTKRRREKFKRVKNACERCKSRKQKCDLQRPQCGNCRKGDAECIIPTPDENWQNSYRSTSSGISGIVTSPANRSVRNDSSSSLEKRVKELEEILAVREISSRQPAYTTTSTNTIWGHGPNPNSNSTHQGQNSDGDSRFSPHSSGFIDENRHPPLLMQRQNGRSPMQGLLEQQLEESSLDQMVDQTRIKEPTMIDRDRTALESDMLTSDGRIESLGPSASTSTNLPPSTFHPPTQSNHHTSSNYRTSPFVSFTQQYIRYTQSPAEASSRVSMNHNTHIGGASKRSHRSSLPTPFRTKLLPSVTEIKRLVGVFFSNRWPNYPIFMKHDLQSRIIDPIIAQRSRHETIAPFKQGFSPASASTSARPLSSPSLGSSSAVPLPGSGIRQSEEEAATTRDERSATISEADLFIVYLVLAIAAIDVQAEEGYDYYLTATTLYLESLMSSNNNDPIMTIQGMMLLAIYAMSDPRGVNLWPLTGLITRGCIDLGLHRNESQNGWYSELQRRIFWSAFALDRSVSIALGRPVSIAVEEISSPLPIPIDDPSDPFPPNPANGAVPDIMAFIHTCRLRAINGMISTALYRPACNVTFPEYQNISIMTPPEADHFRNETKRRLSDWLDKAPLYPPPPTSTYKTRDWFQIAHAHSLLILYRPTSLYPDLSPSAMQICADASMSLIAAYLRLYTFARVTYTWVALHSLFMAALTAHYVLQNSPALRRSTSHDVVEINMNGCSKIFSAMSIQWPNAKSCQQVCEAMTLQTLSIFEKDAEESRKAAEQALMATTSSSSSTMSSARMPMDPPPLPLSVAPAGSDSDNNLNFPDLRPDLWAWLHTNQDNVGTVESSTQSNPAIQGQRNWDPGFEQNLFAGLLDETYPPASNHQHGVPPMPTASTADNIFEGLTAVDLDNLLYMDPNLNSWVDFNS